MISWYVKDTLEAIRDVLTADSDLSAVITGVWTVRGWNLVGYYCTRSKAAISVFPMDSGQELPWISDNSLKNTILPTTFGIACDYKVGTDRTRNLPTVGNGPLDYEKLILNALEEVPFFGVNSNMGWRIQGIERDQSVLNDEGEQDPDIERFTIRILVACYHDRIDAQARYR